MVMLKIRYETLISSSVIVELRRGDACPFEDSSHTQHKSPRFELFQKINLNLELDCA